MAIMVGGDVDGGGPLLFTAGLVAFCCAFVFSGMGVNAPLAALSSIWMPVFLVYFRLYGALGADSAGSGAQRFVEEYGWQYAPAAAATALILAAVCVPAVIGGKLCGAFERWYRRQYGKSFFDPDGYED